MRIFVFEFITGGGWFLIDKVNAPTGSLLREGNAMLQAVAEDFSAIDGVEVVTLIDARLASGPLASPMQSREAATADCTNQRRTAPIKSVAELHEQFMHAAGLADFTLVIAPEFDNHLANFAQKVTRARGRLLSPSAKFIQLTSNKHRTAQWLGNANVPTPHGLLVSKGKTIPSDFPFPAVLKPIDGAGSLDVQRIEDVAQLATWPRPATMRLEQFHPGTPVSVAAIGGPTGFTLLPPCLQKLSSDGNFTYLGGECPIDDALAKRASRLAERALRSFLRPNGYIGIDMVLGNDPSGNDDVVIEVNPRLTTSYVGLRKLVRENLAAAMLAAAQGQAFELSTHPHRVKFAADSSADII